MKKLITSIIIVLVVVLELHAQQHEVLTHYITNPYLYNSARVGQDKHVDFGFLLRKQWLNVPDAPDTKIFTVQGMVKNKFGVGAKLYMDKAHIIENFGAKFSYAYYVRAKKNPDDHYFSIGVAAGFKHQGIRFDEATIDQENDQAIFYNGVRKTIFDADAGFNYYMKGLNVGLGVSNLAPLSYNYSYSDKELKYSSIYHLYGNVSYDIKMGSNKDLILKPGALVRYVPNIPMQIDGSLLFDYKNIFWIGGGYRYKDAGVWGMAGVRLFEMVSVGYAYEQSVDGYQAALGTTHEINLGFRLKSKSKSEKDQIDVFKDEYASKFQNSLDSLKAEQEKLKEQNEGLEQKLNEQAEEQTQLINTYQENSNTINQENKSVINEFKNIGSVEFDQDASNMYQKHKTKLDSYYAELVPLLESDNLIMVYLKGTASIEGDEEYNLVLSNKRVENVRQYLISKGIPEDIISSTYKGNSEAVIKSTLKEYSEEDIDKQINEVESDRAVQIFILKK